MVYHWTHWNSSGIDLEGNGSEFMGSRQSVGVGTGRNWPHMVAFKPVSTKLMRLNSWVVSAWLLCPCAKLLTRPKLLRVAFSLARSTFPHIMNCLQSIFLLPCLHEQCLEPKGGTILLLNACPSSFNMLSTHSPVLTYIVTRPLLSRWHRSNCAVCRSQVIVNTSRWAFFIIDY